MDGPNMPISSFPIWITSPFSIRRKIKYVEFLCYRNFWETANLTDLQLESNLSTLEIFRELIRISRVEQFQILQNLKIVWIIYPHHQDLPKADT